MTLTYPPQGPNPGNPGPFGQVPPNYPYPPQSPPPQGFSPQAQPYPPTPAVPAAQKVVDALPAALRTSLIQNKVTDTAPRPGDKTDTFEMKTRYVIKAHDSLVEGLQRHADIEHYPIAWIDNDPTKLRRIWNSQHPEYLTDEGARLIRIADKQPDGSATLEVFVPATNLYLVLSGFSDKAAAQQFVQRAGF